MPHPAFKSYSVLRLLYVPPPLFPFLRTSLHFTALAIVTIIRLLWIGWDWISSIPYLLPSMFPSPQTSRLVHPSSSLTTLTLMHSIHTLLVATPPSLSLPLAPPIISRQKRRVPQNSGQYIYLDTLPSTNSYVAYYLPKSDKMYIDEPTELKVRISHLKQVWIRKHHASWIVNTVGIKESNFIFFWKK